MQDHPARFDSFGYSQAMQIADQRKLLYNSIFESKVTICIGDEFD